MSGQSGRSKRWDSEEEENERGRYDDLGGGWNDPEDVTIEEASEGPKKVYSRKGNKKRKGLGIKIGLLVLIIILVILNWGHISLFKEKSLEEEETRTPPKQIVKENIKTAESETLLKKEANYNVRLIEEHIIDITNKERERAGLKPLVQEMAMSDAAREHSKYLMSFNEPFSPEKDIYIEHVGEGGSYEDDRLNSAGVYNFDLSAENVGTAMSFDYYYEGSLPSPIKPEEQIASDMVAGWMGSRGHRENMLNPIIEKIGVGVAIDDKGLLFIGTQVFIREVNCGYENGPCCFEEGRYPSCHIPLRCDIDVCHE